MMEQNRSRQLGAFVLIGLGVIFLLGSLGINLNFNWWALLIAIPGVIILNNVYRTYQEQGRLEGNDIVQGLVGLFMLVLAASGLFNFGFDFLRHLWPLVLIGIGLVMLFGHRGEA